MNKKDKKLRRQKSVRKKIKGTKVRPRLSVFRSNRLIYAQIIDDQKGETIIGVSEKGVGKDAKQKKEQAYALGVLLAKKALDKKIKKVVFDRGSYAYHGRVEALALGAREGGLEF
ncbi:MAG: 50S ribosomal protein L18 [Candidatus Levybacteria bacterium]|nr:50S ribosomal protein L18 [Candidatus Levybacteria bacterium]